MRTRPLARLRPYLALTPARRRHSRAAFTLLELIVVIVILGILALLAIPTFAKVIAKSHDTVTEQTLGAVGRDVAALAALGGGAITTSDVTTAIGELPSAAAAPGVLAAGAGYSATTGASTSPTVISYDVASGGASAGLAALSSSGDVVYAFVEQSSVQTWVGCAAPTGTEALAGKASSTSGCAATSTSGSSSSGYGSGGPGVITPPTGTPTVYTVPSGVSYVQVTAAGAQGAGDSAGPGGEGGAVSAVIPVTAGQTFFAYLGSTTGTVSGAPGNFGAGGTSATSSAGGGATSVFLTDGSGPTAPTASTLGSLVLVGGGGGGGTDWSWNGAMPGYPGGNPGGGGSLGATQTTPGAPNGAFGQGGAGGVNGEGVAGSGGGGFEGGGGGQADFSFAPGGGGSSWVEAAASGVTYDNGVNTGNGTVSFRPVGAVSPSGLTATYDSTTGNVNLSWVASPSTNVTGYVIYRNGTELTTVSGATTTSYTDTSAPQGTTVTYGVAATTSGLSSVTVTANVTIPPPGGTPPKTNLVGWYEAGAGLTMNGSSVSGWADQSGNGNNLTQPTTTWQPGYTASGIDGRPTLLFNPATPQALSGSIPQLAGTSDPTVVVVGYTNSPSVQVPVQAGTDVPGGGQEWLLCVFPNPANGAQPALHVESGSGSNGLTGPTSLGTGPTSASMWEASYSGTNVNLSVNGQADGSAASTSSVTLPTPPQLNVGLILAAGGNPSDGLNGGIAEVLVYSHPLTASQQSALTTYLTTKYGLS